jgi:lipoprotein-anchoring transpeptidase ErfK/SrfK
MRNGSFEGMWMNPPSLLRRTSAILGAMLVFMLSASLTLAVANDYRSRGLVPKGVTVVGQDLSGMTEAEARATIESAVSQPMLRSLTVSGDKKHWALAPVGFVTIDEESMIGEAYSTRRAATLLARIDSDLRGTPLTNEVKPMYAIDKNALAKWVAQVAKRIDRKPVDATRTVAGYKLTIRHSKYGAKVNRGASVRAIAKALTAEAALSGAPRTANLAVIPLKPKVLDSSIKNTIIVSLPDCEIHLYVGAKLVKTYPCAPGQPSWPTPTGDFHIVDKLADAPWYNPHSAWSASMPDIIPGGPGNPMGDRKIAIDYPGVFMHGIPSGEYSSIGTHASHGCMRMFPSDVHDLFKRVRIGDPVYIRG